MATHAEGSGWAGAWCAAAATHAEGSGWLGAWCAAALLVSGFVRPLGAAEVPPVELNFEKRTLTERFFSEGAHLGDLNRDGHVDVVSGPFWYAGPDFQQRHEYFPAQPFDPKGYSNAFLIFVHDFNADGWSDILVVGWPGKEAFWYENPQAKAGHWKQHLAFPVVDNESPVLADLTGDSRPELVFHTGGRLGYAAPDPQRPGQPWTFTPVSDKGPWKRYTHGLGVGDVNGDGRSDILMREGWWEQPASDDAPAPWKHHPADFGEGGAQMLVLDVDGDGDRDVVTSLQAHGYGLAWFENVTDGASSLTFRRHLIVGGKTEDNPFGVKFSQIHALALCDIDRDGLLDVVTGKRYWAHGPGGDVEPDAPAVLYWFRLVHHTDGRELEFIPYLVDDDSGVGTQVTAGDVNGDGRPDILVGNKKGAFVFLQQEQPPELISR